MTFDPIKELADIMERNRTRPEESLPRAISGPREILDERDERGWFGYFMEGKARCRKLAVDLWQFLSEWFDSWFRVVLTGCVIGAVIGLAYRWSLLQ